MSPIYPLNTSSPWSLNQWYIAGFSSDVTREILGRTILGKKMVFFRDKQGDVHALSGICPHRMMPLEMGYLDGDNLVCGYHGITFDTDGKCVATPSANKLANCQLIRYPVHEAGPLLWVWPGDPERADPDKLPDQGSIGIDAKGWRTDCVQRLLLKARYQLLVDNLFDLSHLGYVHASILDFRDIALSEPLVEEREGRLIVSRTLSNVPTDDYHRYLYPDIGDTMSIRIETDMVGIGLINAGGPVWNGNECADNLTGHMNFIHGITPETETTTHYYSILTRDFRLDDDELTHAMIAQNKAVIQQDVDVLEEIETLLGSNIDMPREISIGSDVGDIRARRYMTRIIEEN